MSTLGLVFAAAVAAGAAWSVTPTHRAACAHVPRRRIEPWTARWRAWRRRRHHLPVGSLCVEVAARLRAGETSISALESTLDRAGITRERLSKEAPEIAAACRFSTDLGAPLADILDGIGAGLGEARAAANQRRLALVGPTMTARLLACLPLAAIGMSALIGADPIAVFFDGRLGTLTAAAGVFAQAAGVVWMRRLIRRARRAEGADR